ncbi:hypothetical protein BC827DRAFT_1377666 [Russula dissimulans]|nr:hypothetical protein BC827DRAFT_1377666 [Russula dissimulans]
MLTFNGPDTHCSLTALRLHLPVKMVVVEIPPEREQTGDDKADPALRRLPAPGLRGTWAQAYAFLTQHDAKVQADVAATSREAITDDNASTKGSHSVDAETTIPTICISTKSGREEKAAVASKVNGRENANGETTLEGLKQPTQAAAGPPCLDNLPGRSRALQVAYRKTALEWDILRDLGLWLRHKEEAKEGFQRALDPPQYLIKPWAKLLEMYAEEDDLTGTLQVSIRVAAYQAKWKLRRLQYPTQIVRLLFKLEQVHVHAKIWNTLVSMGLPEPILLVMQQFLQYGMKMSLLSNYRRQTIFEPSDGLWLVSPLPAQTIPSRSSSLKITLKLPTQTQEPSRAPRTIHKDKGLDSDIESEGDEEDDHPHGGDGKRPLTPRGVKRCSQVSLCPSHVSLDEMPCKKEQLNEAVIARRREETPPKRRHLSEKKQRRSLASWHNQPASAKDRTPAIHTGNGTPAEGEVDEEESGEAAAVPVVEVSRGATGGSRL